MVKYDSLIEVSDYSFLQVSAHNSPFHCAHLSGAQVSLLFRSVKNNYHMYKPHYISGENGKTFEQLLAMEEK